MRLLKHFIKKYLWRWAFYNKLYGPSSIRNKEHANQLSQSGGFIKEELNVFTTAGEDGILLNIFAKTGAGSKTFVDIGSNDCINSNCANLAFHHGWKGLFIDGNKQVLERGRHIYKRYFKEKANRFSFLHAIVTPDNINEIIETQLPGSSVDLLSIDLDGNDYFIWEKLHTIQPRVVVAEVQVEKGLNEFIPDYSNAFELYEDTTPKGASPLSMKMLAEKKGYTLVAANKGCYNLFFVRNDCLSNLPEADLEKLLQGNS